MDTEPSSRASHGGRVSAGLLIIFVGVVLLLDQTGLGGIRLVGSYWPVLLIALGAFRLADPACRDGRRASRRPGAWLIYVGGWGLLNELHLFGFEYGTSWPLMVIGVGLFLVWRALDSEPRGCATVREN